MNPRRKQRIEYLQGKLARLERASRTDVVENGYAITFNKGRYRLDNRKVDRVVSRVVNRAVEIARLKDEISRLTPLPPLQRKSKKQATPNLVQRAINKAWQNLSNYGVTVYEGHHISTFWEWDEEQKDLFGLVIVNYIEHRCGAEGVHIEMKCRDIMRHISIPQEAR